MPKALNGYNEATATSFKGRDKLPVGGYVLKIMNVREENYDWGDVIVLQFDIADGEYSGFFKKQYDAASDEYKKWKGTHRINIPAPESDKEEDVKRYKRRLGFFKSQIKAFEDSNSGLKINCESAWDATVLKGKKVGAVFGNQEYYNANTGQSYWFTGLDHLVSVDDIINNDFKIPADKPDKKKPKNDETFSTTDDTSNPMGDFDELEEGDVPF